MGYETAIITGLIGIAFIMLTIAWLVKIEILKIAFVIFSVLFLISITSTSLHIIGAENATATAANESLSSIYNIVQADYSLLMYLFRGMLAFLLVYMIVKAAQYLLGLKNKKELKIVEEEEQE